MRVTLGLVPGCDPGVDKRSETRVGFLLVPRFHIAKDISVTQE
jgi:hypothetical protein